MNRTPDHTSAERRSTWRENSTAREKTDPRAPNPKTYRQDETQRSDTASHDGRNTAEPKEESRKNRHSGPETNHHEEQTGTESPDEPQRQPDKIAKEGPEWSVAKRLCLQDRLEEEGIAREEARALQLEDDRRQRLGEPERIAQKDVNLHMLRGGIVWGKAETDKNYRIYFKTQICEDHPQKAELKAAALLHTHPEGSTRDYQTPVGKAGSEEGKTLVSATVVDTRARAEGFEDTIRVTMKPGEQAGEVIERAQVILDSASGTRWWPWRHKSSGVTCTRSMGETLSPTETMPTREHTIYLNGTKGAKLAALKRKARNQPTSKRQMPNANRYKQPKQGTKGKEARLETQGTINTVRELQIRNNLQEKKIEHLEATARRLRAEFEEARTLEELRIATKRSATASPELPQQDQEDKRKGKRARRE